MRKPKVTAGIVWAIGTFIQGLAVEDILDGKWGKLAMLTGGLVWTIAGYLWPTGAPKVPKLPSARTPRQPPPIRPAP